MATMDDGPSQAEMANFEIAQRLAKNLGALDFKDADGQLLRWTGGVGGQHDEIPYVHVFISDRWGKKGEITGYEVWDTENVDGDPLISAERQARDIAGALAVMGIVAERPYVGNHPVAQRQMGYTLSFWTIELHADQINQRELERWAAPRIAEKAEQSRKMWADFQSRNAPAPV